MQDRHLCCTLHFHGPAVPPTFQILESPLNAKSVLSMWQVVIVTVGNASRISLIQK